MNTSQTLNQKQTVRLIVFEIAGYRFGLPLHRILRVVNCPDDLRSRPVEPLELFPVGQQTLSVLNLRSQLGLAPTDQAGDFLVIAKIKAELCAIRVDAPPDLIEVDATAIRQLPAPYRQGHPLSIASQVVVLPQGKATLAVFLLEIERLFACLGASR
ncbi:chemotaxis protein CheW [Leptolyngbya sp. DQ-M1]|uniref:chemotaxis protein CheW n=1 Tax=Leptolyngbya sp. DQ-M1 TaxID=2933920 RepID=UPI00329A763E